MVILVFFTLSFSDLLYFDNGFWEVKLKTFEIEILY